MKSKRDETVIFDFTFRANVIFPDFCEEIINDIKLELLDNRYILT